MKLTRQHYEVFASIFGEHWHRLPPEFVNDFIHYLIKNNPKFDKDRFAAAVARSVPGNRPFEKFMAKVLTPVHIDDI